MADQDWPIKTGRPRLAIARRLRCVEFSGRVFSALRIKAAISSSPISRGTPGRVASQSPSIRRSAKRFHQLPARRADTNLGSDAVRHSLKIRAITDVIPPKSNRIGKRGCGFSLYRKRNLVEHFFNTIKHFRGIVPRSEKTARNARAALHLACALSWLK